MLDFAVYDLGREIDSFFGMFLASGVAARFETGDCAVLVGMSGVELAYEVLEQSGIHTKRVKPNYTVDRSREYWTGWALAYYQRETSLRFAEIVVNRAQAEYLTMLARALCCEAEDLMEKVL